MPWQIHGNCLEQMAQRRNIRFMKNVQTVSYFSMSGRLASYIFSREQAYP